MNDKTECGKRIKTLRILMGKTQQEVAAETMISIDTLRKLEQGKRWPSIIVTDVLKNYYHTTSDYILFGDNGRQGEMMHLCPFINANKDSNEKT